MNLNIVYVSIFAFFGLIGYIFADYMQIYLRYRGAVFSKIATGYSNAMKSMVVMRIGAVLYMFLIAFSVERGLASETMTKIACVALPLCGLPIALMLPKLIALRSIAPDSMKVARPKIMWEAVFYSAVAVTFNLLGLTIPFILGIQFPEFRLTLAQTSIFFNVFYTMITVFVIESQFSKLVDSKDSKYHDFCYSLTVGRILGSVSGGVVICIIFFGKVF